ncbi:hypothetical protein HMN09_01027900 [Mycena chlorophos]|uniref:Uncharacterized protein n=1 Tax=Mycena chlorophos TaxID=658473 RepID=A0A8H6W026_MYCCL|nr:hypothetical protein HMN09_01027900 [Mycena chlorophos]
MSSSSPPFFQRQLLSTQASHRGRPATTRATAVHRAPIVNPYEKFTQPQFDAWIGDITGALKDALGFRAKTPPRPKAKREWHVPRRSQSAQDEDDEVMQEEEEEDEEEQVMRESAKAKGKGRDPREGPGLGGGDRETPIEILDSDEEEQEQEDDDEDEEEDEEEGEDWDSEFSEDEEEEEEQEALVNGESTRRANARFRKYAARNAEQAHVNGYAEEDYDNETGSESESDAGDGSSPPRVLIETDEDELGDDQDMEPAREEDAQIFNVDDDDDEENPQQDNLDDDILPASSPIQTSPVEPLSQSFSSTPHVYTLDDEDDDQQEQQDDEEIFSGDAQDTTWDWNNPPAFPQGVPTSASGHLVTPEEEEDTADPLFDENFVGPEYPHIEYEPDELPTAIQKIFPDGPAYTDLQTFGLLDEDTPGAGEPLASNLELEELLPASVQAEEPSASVDYDASEQPLEQPIEEDIPLLEEPEFQLFESSSLQPEPVVAADVTPTTDTQVDGDATEQPIVNEEPKVAAESVDETPVVTQPIESVEEPDPVVLESLPESLGPVEDTVRESTPIAAPQIVSETPELDDLTAPAPVDEPSLPHENVEAPSLRWSFGGSTRPPLFFPDSDDADPLLESEPFLSDGFYGGDEHQGGPEYFVEDDEEFDDQQDHVLGHLDARTVSRSVSVDPHAPHQRFVVEEASEDGSNLRSRAQSIDIVALDDEEHQPGLQVMESIEEEQGVLSSTKMDDVLSAADAARMSPSWSPSLPAHVPMPILADPMAADPSELTKSTPDDNNLLTLPSLLRARHEASLFTPSGSASGTPPSLEQEVEVVEVSAESTLPSVAENAQDFVEDISSEPSVIVEDVVEPQQPQIEESAVNNDFEPPALSVDTKSGQPLESDHSGPTSATAEERTDGEDQAASTATSFELDHENDDVKVPDGDNDTKALGEPNVEDSDLSPAAATDEPAVQLEEDVEGSDTDADGEDDGNELQLASASEGSSDVGENDVVGAGDELPAVVEEAPVDEELQAEAEVKAEPVEHRNGDAIQVEPVTAEPSATNGDLSRADPESAKSKPIGDVFTEVKAEEAPPSPADSESNSLKRKREEEEDDMPSVRANFGKIARSRLDRKGKGKAEPEDDDAASSASSASSAARLLDPDASLSSVAGSPLDERTSYMQDTSPTRRIIKIVRSSSKYGSSPPPAADLPPPPPPPPPLPPVLMHAHSRGANKPLMSRQNTLVRPPPQRTPSRINTNAVAAAQPGVASPTLSVSSVSEHTPAPKPKPKAQHVPIGTPITRAHCIYHKISLPELGDDDEDRTGPRVCFVVPGCSLTDSELLREEDIKDEGGATDIDGDRMTDRIETVGLRPEVIQVIRHLVGVDIFREREVYYLPREGEIVEPHSHQHQPSPAVNMPLKRERSHKMRSSMSGFDTPLSPAASTSSRAPHSRAESSSTTSLSGIKRKKGRRGSPALSQVYSQADDEDESDEDDESPADKQIREAERAGRIAAESNTPIRTRRHRQATEDPDYKPEDDEEADMEADGGHEKPTNKKRSAAGKKRGVKRSRQSEVPATPSAGQDGVDESPTEERKRKKLKTRESVGPV